MLSVNGRIRVELLLVWSINAVLPRENYLPLAAHLNCYSQENFSCVSSALSLAVFSVAPKIFNKSLKKCPKSSRRLNLSPPIYWLPKLGQGSDLVRKIVTQRMNLQEFSNVIFVFDSNI